MTDAEAVALIRRVERRRQVAEANPRREGETLREHIARINALLAERS